MVGFIVLALCSLVFAQQHGVIFPVSTTETSYTLADNAYDENDLSTGVRFSFTAPSTDSYQVIFYTGSGDFYFASCTDNTYSSCSSKINFYRSSNNPYYYTFSATSGTNYYFKIIDFDNTSYSHSTYTFTAKYQKTQIITLTSASPNCSTSVTSQIVTSSGYYTFTGYGKPGYRPNGWKITSGTANLTDSAASSIKVNTSSNVTLEMQCTTASLIDITETPSAYTPITDFYVADTYEMRFRFTSPEEGTYAIEATPNYYAGTLYWYNDDTFSTTRASVLLGSNPYALFVTSTAAGQNFYFGLTPYSTSYLNYSTTINATKAATISVEGYTTPFNTTKNKAINITAQLDSGYTFLNWSLESGKGTFGDSSKMSTTFTPTSEESSIVINKKKGSVYTLTDKYSGFTFEKNGSKTNNNLYGIRTTYKTSDSGYFALVTKSTDSYSTYLYYDNTFTSTRSSANCSYNKECKLVFLANADSSLNFLLNQASEAYYKDSVYAKIAKILKITSDTSESGTVYIGSSIGSNEITYIPGDTIPISASSTSERFSQWQKVSGTCTIVDSTEAKTQLIAKTDCKIRAVFKKGTIYPITTTERKNLTHKDYYTGSSYSGGIAYYLAPKKEGLYIVTFIPSIYSTPAIYKYDNRDFSSYLDYSYGSDTVSVSAGDTIFYMVKGTDNDTITAKARKASSVTLTVTSSSPHCSTNISSQSVIDGTEVTIRAYSEKNYFPRGWEIKSGGRHVRSESRIMLIDTIMEATSIVLNCDTANLHDITDSLKEYEPHLEYYDTDSSSGMRFRAIAPTDSPYTIYIDSPIFRGTAYYYGTDSTFSSLITTQSLSNSSYYYTVTPTKKGESFYLTIKPNDSYYYHHPIYIQMTTQSVIRIISSETKIDTIFANKNTPETILPQLSSGQHFLNWEIISGKGVFENEYQQETIFTPKSDTVTIKAVTSQLNPYPLSSKNTTYNFTDNSSNVTNGLYGIRYVFVATDSEDYTIIYKTNTPTYLYFFDHDSTYSSANYSRSCSSEICKQTISVNKKGKIYLAIAPSNKVYTDDISIRMLKSVSIATESPEHGSIYISSTTYVPGDTVPLSASEESGYRFNKWELVSGKCTILDNRSANTFIIAEEGCKIKATFTPGLIYTITKTPKEYSTAEHYYSQGASNGVRFAMKAPSSGKFAIVISGTSGKFFGYNRYHDNTFYTPTYQSRTSLEAFVDTMTLAKDDSVFVKVSNYNSYDSNATFWISFSTSTSSLTVKADPNGTASPHSIDPIWNNAYYAIRASGNTGYRFSKWETTKGSPSILDANSPSTLVSTTGDAEIQALFRKSSVFKLKTTKQTFNFQENYYDEDDYEVRFTWTPTDDEWHYISFSSSDTSTTYIQDYSTDSMFLSATSSVPISKKDGYLFKGESGKPLYWGITLANNSSLDKNFSIKISSPSTLNIEVSSHGTTSPSGEVMLPLNGDTLVKATPSGGYTFSSWESDSCGAVIESPKKSETRVQITSSYCSIRANYSLNFSFVPELKINSLDLSNHPGICAQVAVTDKQTGRSIAGLDSNDFILFQDGSDVPLQATTIEEITGISVVLVVDESGSMSGTRMTQAVESVKTFINEMGPYDRVAIVGFGTDVHITQAMTSDKALLLRAANTLRASGDCYINEGVELGLEQLVGEINPTTAIVFSDGLGGGRVPTENLVSRAKELGTNIYSISIGGDYPHPLRIMAESTDGTYTYAPTADKLAEIYASIRNSVKARYVICYESPDQTLDNDKHEVIIKTNLYGKNDADTTYWREDFMPPRITLTQATQDMIGVSQEAGDSIVIGAYIKTTKSISAATIYLRQAANPSNQFTKQSMVQVNDSLWTYTIPAYDVEFPAIDFYIIAEEAGSGLLGKSPSVPAPSREPYTIPIDNDVPIVKLSTEDCLDTTSGGGKLSFAITDSNGIYESYIYYKDTMDVLFYEKSMSHTSGSNKWTAIIPSKFFKNGSAEYYVRALDSTGTAVRWPKNRSRYIAACADTTVEDTIPTVVVKDSIILLNGENPKSKISRSTSELALKIWSKSFSDKVDTITAAVKCLRSGDTESNVKMVEKEDGQYENLKKLYKDEYPAKKNNGSVSCEATDTLVAAYKNPETKKTVYDTVAISDFVNLTYQFLKVKDDEDLDSVKTSTKAKFRLRVTTTSPKATKIDTISVKLFTHKKDTITVNAIETDINSAVFDYTGAFYFQEDSLSMNDTLLDAVFDFNKSVNRIKIQAQCDKDSSKLADRDSLIVYSAYIPADSAEIYDKNLDGKADFVRIHFQEPLKKDIESIDSVFWPKSGHGTDYYKVKKSSIKIEDDPSWVQAKLEKGAKYGKTAPDTVDKPYLRVTKTSSDMSQKVFLADMVGAVAAKAEKHPGKVLLNDYVDSEVEIPPDTLVITMSEKIKRTGKKDAWKKLFRYSTSCEDTASRAIKIAEDPVVDSSGRVWTLVLGDYSILVGYCIRTNPDAEYIGADSNSLGIGGAEITGEDGTLYLYDVSPNPSVSGIGKKAKWIPPEGKEFKNVPDTLSTVKVMSVSPYIADIYIYDNQGQFVNKLQEKFGYNGEMEDPLRGNSSKREKLGFLYWDQRTENGRKVGTGVYIWKIFFKFTDGHAEIRTLKTGVRRSDDSEK